jgi:hypothetical protein
MMTNIAPAARAPAHLWIVGVLGIIWNGFGVYDYLMSKLKGVDYFRQMGMTDAQIAFAQGYPVWMNAVWAIGVWGGLLGSVLLLLRRRAAAPVFAASLIAYLVSLFYTFFLSNGRDVMGGTAPMHAVVLAGCLFFAWYSRAMARKGVLK